MTLHVYGVVHDGAPLPDLAGVGDPPGDLRLVAGAGLAAVVSEVAEESQLTDQDAVRHLDVLTAIVARSGVLPLRFGTAAPEESAVREEVLEPASAQFRAQLDALQDYVELRVDLSFDEESGLREVLADHPQLRAGQSPGGGFEERVQLGEQISQQLTAWTRAQGDRLMAELTPLTAQARRWDGTPPHVDRWSLLVPRDRIFEVDSAVRKLQGHAGVAVEYVGPLPAYSFLGVTGDPQPSGEPGDARPFGDADSAAPVDRATPSGRWGW